MLNGRALAELGVVPQAGHVGRAGTRDARKEARGFAELTLALVVGQELEGLPLGFRDALQTGEQVRVSECRRVREEARRGGAPSPAAPCAGAARAAAWRACPCARPAPRPARARRPPAPSCTPARRARTRKSAATSSSARCTRGPSSAETTRPPTLPNLAKAFVTISCQRHSET